MQVLVTKDFEEEADITHFWNLSFYPSYNKKKII